MFVNCAVLVDNLSFGYNRTDVLNNLSLKIKCGEIFALLGANGCGKTTLLKCIIGRIKPKNGLVLVYGKEPGHNGSYIPGPAVGYMPQEIGLVQEVTTEENLRFFSKIFRMNSQQFEERFKELIQLLNLKNQKINELSGGQQRLVSMAVSILHRPKLIILDEPTVGVDPILRTKIWSYLEDMCYENGNTVIITTHYIEEAKRASTVAFMKSGAILRHANPQTLMNEHLCDSLETVYHNLWKPKDQNFNEKSFENKASVENIYAGFIKTSRRFKFKNIMDFHRILALIWSFNRRVRRFPFLVICYICIPLVSIFAMYLSNGHLPHDIPVAVHSEERTALLSQQFINSLDSNLLNVIQYQSRNKTIDSLIKGKNTFAIFFDQNFTKDFETRLLKPFELSDKELNGSTIKLYTDSSNALVLVYGLQYLAQVLQQFVSNVSLSLNLNPNAFKLPLAIEEPIYGTHPITAPLYDRFRMNYDYLVPSFILITIHFISIVFSCFVMVLHRRDSRLERYFVSGGQPIELLLSVYISILFYAIIKVFVLLMCGTYIFDIKLVGSFTEVYLLCLLQSLQGLAIGLLLALPFKQEFSTLAAIALFMFPMYVVSGVLWPLESIPSYIRVISDWTPLTKPIDSLRSIMLRGMDSSHPIVMNGFIVSISYTFITFAFSAILFHYNPDPFI